MLNQIIFVGRTTSKIEVVKDENGAKYAVITLAIPRSFKNSDGEYETDYISAIAYDNIAANTAEYLLPGDIVGIKGHAERLSQDSELKIIVEKITFLSKSKSEESE